jgi:ABC-type Co2+ transport system permease subunit
VKRTGDIKESAAYLTLMTRYLQTAYKVRIYMISNLLVILVIMFSGRSFIGIIHSTITQNIQYFFLSRTRH